MIIEGREPDGAPGPPPDAAAPDRDPPQRPIIMTIMMIMMIMITIVTIMLVLSNT